VVRTLHAGPLNERTASGPSLARALRFWLKLGFVNFGGPTGQIAIMHDELVDRKAWIDEDRFLHALSFCMLLPGPEAQQLAIYVGWLLNGTAGGIAAGILFVLPAAVAMIGLAWTYAAHGDVAWVAAVFDGLSAAVVGIVAVATIAIGRRAVKGPTAAGVSAFSFLAIFVFGFPFPFVILAAALLGTLVGPSRFGVRTDVDVLVEAVPRPRPGSQMRVIAVGLLTWWLPILAVVAIAGPASVYAREGLFFSQVAVVTFGGAYAVLAYVGREVVARFGLNGADVVAGLGLAETTPGPLILVVEFLGFIAAYREPGDLSPAVAGLLGAGVTLWATFAPCFLWIFVGAPWVERLRASRRLRGALSAVTAAVVGVIVSLSVTVALLVLFEEVRPVTPFRAPIPWPTLASVNLFHVCVAVAAFVAIRRLRMHVVWVVVASAAAGLLWSLVR
jgi:chromate transporter